MIVAVGEIEARQLIEDLIVIARGENEINEKNVSLGKFRHADGWGIAYMDMDGRWHVHKSTCPIFEDENISMFNGITAKAIILHARKATKGNRSLDNTQPIIYTEDDDDYLFTHNGTIQDDFSPSRKRVSGESDSVMWFNSIIDDIKKEGRMLSFPTVYSSANFFLVTPEKIIVGEDYKDAPRYHTMKFCHEEGRTIVSSEVLPTMKEKHWRDMPNQSTIELDFTS